MESGSRKVRVWVSATDVYGFSDAEMAGVNDARMVRVLHDAYQWRQLQAKQPGITKRIEASKGVARPASKAADPHRQEVANLKRALKLTKDPQAQAKIAERLFMEKIK